MSEFATEALERLAGSSSKWARYTGFRWLARKIRRRMALSMIGIGATFFPSRDALNQSRDFNEFLGTAEDIDAIFVTGRVFIQDHHDKFRRIKRIIFPNPESASFKFYESHTGETDLAACIRRATVICREKTRMHVRWAPELIQQSILIGDSDKRTGWVHAEFVLPLSTANSRPSITIRRTRYEALVKSYQEIFDKLWDISIEPPMEAVAKNQIPKESEEYERLLARKLVMPGWIMNFNPRDPRGRKALHFHSDGTFGEGGNPNEYAWKIIDGLLVITRENGTLQNTFRYESSTDRFICTNDPPHSVDPRRGIDDQIIYRAEIK
jgi:hypothetical protein